MTKLISVEVLNRYTGEEKWRSVEQLGKNQRYLLGKYL